ncbi:MAG TPA: NADH-quinone oxidoreductase subunit J [Bacteroidales bacterium]|nr:NADH-quinone oxidoreductase subunit J [Bacteroidales bacterium]HSA42321.1 NADH-quinone oxidoreductase subunit J [Bacteroidales bacterium]
MTFLFYLLAAVAILTAMMVVLSRNPVGSVIHLVLCFLAIAGHFILLNAQFLAVVHIIVYTGAILVLFLFVIMLLNLNPTNEPRKTPLTRFIALIAGGLLFLVLIASLRGAMEIRAANPFNHEIGLVRDLGKVLFKDFLVPFEISSVLFISAMVGAVLLGKRDPLTKN